MAAVTKNRTYGKIAGFGNFCDGQDENNRRGEDITKPYGDGHLG
jgi:hypothetical protein